MKDALTPEQTIDAVPEPKRSELRALHDLIRKTLPELEPGVGAGMIGYGKYHYRYASGREGDWYRVGLAANKTGISVYVAMVDENGYLAEQAGKRLGKVSVGKSCIRFKRLSDVDLPVLTKVLERVRTAKALGEVDPADRPPPKKRAAVKARVKV